MTADEDGDGGKTRWLDAVRYTVAAVVTVLIVTVIVVAIKVVLRPESLRLSVVGGFVSSTPRPGATAAVELNVKLQAENPSGRARIYFLNITAYLFDNKTLAASTADPEQDCIINFGRPDFAVAQQMAVFFVMSVLGENETTIMDPNYFGMLYTKRRTISEVVMRVDGRLVTEVRSGANTTSHLATYYCWPLVVGEDEARSGMDVPCTENQSDG